MPSHHDCVTQCSVTAFVTLGCRFGCASLAIHPHLGPHPGKRRGGASGPSAGLSARHPGAEIAITKLLEHHPANRQMIAPSGAGKWGMRMIHSVMTDGTSGKHNPTTRREQCPLAKLVYRRRDDNLGTSGRSGIAQDQPIKRTELMRYDLPGVPGKEVVVYVADLAPGAKAGRHHHPGEEIVYVLEGTLALEPDNSPPVLLHKGEILRNPGHQVHNAWNASDIAPARVLRGDGRGRQRPALSDLR